jgi:hypothetical protein
VGFFLLESIQLGTVAMSATPRQGESLSLSVAPPREIPKADPSDVVDARKLLMSMTFARRVDARKLLMSMTFVRETFVGEETFVREACVARLSRGGPDV